MFDLSITEEKITIIESQGGQECILNHYVTRPDDETFLKYQRKLTDIRGGRKLKWEFNRTDAAKWLYDQIIQRVEGYTFKGKPIQEMTDSDFLEVSKILKKNITNWKDMIPLAHKVEVAEQVIRINITEEEAIATELGE